MKKEKERTENKQTFRLIKIKKQKVSILAE